MTDPLRSLERAKEIAAQLEEENALLLRQRAALRSKLVQSEDVLGEIARRCRGDSQKVEGKAQGVRLALSYLDAIEGVA